SHALPTQSFFFQFPAAHRDLHSFPTRRSSDLLDTGRCRSARVLEGQSARSSGKRQSSRGGNSFTAPHHRGMPRRVSVLSPYSTPDRKSTRLNSSHVAISYAVFCLKKKTIRYTD